MIGGLHQYLESNNSFWTKPSTVKYQFKFYFLDEYIYICFIYVYVIYIYNIYLCFLCIIVNAYYTFVSFTCYIIFFLSHLLVQ